MQSKNIYVFTGPRGVGKTTAVCTFPKADEVSRTLVVDTEDSTSDIVRDYALQGLQFGCILRGYDRFKPDKKMLANIAKGELPWAGKSGAKSELVGYYEWLLQSLDSELEHGKFTNVVFDTIEPVEAAMQAAIEANPKAFGWSGSRAYGRLEVEGVRPLYDNLFEAIHARGVQNILITTHIKPVWMGDQPVLNKVKPGGRLNILARLSTMMIWLVMDGSNPDGAPAGLVIKGRQGLSAVAEDGYIDRRRVLPRRIPHFSWRDVNRYMTHPADFTHPADGEVPSADEEQMMSEFLTNAQMGLMQLAYERQVRDEGGPTVTVLTDEQREQLREFVKDDMPLAMVARKMALPLAVIQDAAADVDFGQ